MDVSNGTGDGTDYRTGSGTTKMITRIPFTPLPSKAVVHVPDPKLDAKTKSWFISFRLPDGEIISRTFDHLVKSVTLVKNGDVFQIHEVAKPVPKPPAKTPKPPVKATKPKKPAKTAKPAKPPAKKKSAA